MACDPQLSQAEREAAFNQLRNAGAVQAIRPFSGKATAENLVDYLNREVFPVLKQTRKAVNDVYRPVLDNAPSGNPLRYLFSSSVVAADPTAGFLRLDNADASLATTIRVNESNSGLQNVVPWLDVMAGSATAPLGVVTVFHQGDPTRFARYDLTAMVDQGSYWDLTVTAVEVSSVTPFQDGDDVAVSFIPGVAGSGAGAIPVGGVGVAVSAAGSSRSSGTVVFSNSNNVSFGMNGGTITASASVAALMQLASYSLTNFTTATAGAGVTATGQTVFLPFNSGFNTVVSSQNVVWNFDGNSLNARAFIRVFGSGIAGGAVGGLLSVVNTNDVTWAMSSTTIAGFGNIVQFGFNYAAPRAISAAGASASAGTVVLSNSNNVSFGMAGGTVTATATVAATRDIGIVSHIGGNVVSSVSQLAFSNASNVTWSLSTAANAATVIASVAAGGAGGIAASAAGSSQSAGTVVWSNSNAISFGMNGSTITAIAASGISAVGAGTLSVNNGLTGLQFQDSNNVSWNMSTNAGTPGRAFVQASATVAATREIGVVSHVGGNTVSSASRLAFSNASGVTWSLSTAANAATVLASVNDQSIGIVSHVGGNSVSAVTRLAFSNASNVTWSLSTAAGAATVLASVAAGGGGGVAWVDGGTTITDGSARAHSGIDVSTLFSAGIGGNSTRNVQLGFAGTNLTGQAHIRIDDATTGAGNVATRLAFLNSNGVTFGHFTTESVAGGRINVITVSYAPLAISAPGNSVSSGTVRFTNFTDGVRGNRIVVAEMGGSDLSLYYAEPCLGGQWNGITGGSPIAFSLNHNRPYLFQPFLDPLNLGGADGFANNNAGVWLLGHTANISNTSTASGGQSFNWTYKLGLYSVEGGIGSRLTLINSASNTLSRASGAAVQSALHGSRWFVFNQTDWSASSGPLTRGNYWVALMISQNTTNDTRASWIASVGMNMGQGTVGVNAASNASARALPFAGFYTTTTGAFPATIASSHVFTNTSASHARLIPALSVRALNNAAFG